MQYFYRAHVTPETVLSLAEPFFTSRGFARQQGDGERATYHGPRGTVEVSVEIEGGHYTRVTLATSEVGESENDKLAKRFLSELHAAEDSAHRVRGAY